MFKNFICIKPFSGTLRYWKIKLFLQSSVYIYDWKERIHLLKKYMLKKKRDLKNVHKFHIELPSSVMNQTRATKKTIIVLILGYHGVHLIIDLSRWLCGSNSWSPTWQYYNTSFNRRHSNINCGPFMQSAKHKHTNLIIFICLSRLSIHQKNAYIERTFEFSTSSHVLFLE